MKSIALALPLLALAACGQSGGNSTKAASPVAAVSPPAGKTWLDVVSATPEGGFVQGNPNAAVKLIEYGSRACPYCAKFDQEGVPELRAGPIAAGKLSYEFRDYPVHGALDLAPIVLGHCVEPTAFFTMLDQMMAEQTTLLANEQSIVGEYQALQAQGPTPQQVTILFAEKLGYLKFVNQRGVPEAKARACIADQKSYDRLQTQTNYANKQYNISGTPTFIINGEVATGVNSWEQLKPLIRNAGAI